MTDFELGIIHGRFQVLHNDHLRYLLEGKKLCRHLVVGITNPDPRLTREDSADRHRHSRLANPLTYWERTLMVRRSLAEGGVALEAFSIVPFPVNFPELYRYYVPLDAVFFLSIYDDWGRKKLATFRSLNLKTHILREVPPEKKGISGSTVREVMLRDGPWEKMVPDGVARLAKQWDIPARLKSLQQDD